MSNAKIQKPNECQSSNGQYSIFLGIIFAALTIIMRVIPHPWNFTPVGALLLYTGFILPRRYLILPLVVLAASDIIIGTYDFRIMAAVYGSYGLIIFASYSLRRHYSWPTVLMTSLGSSLLFFFITNAAVWLWSGMYPSNLSGLTMSYLAGIPFFRNSLAGDLFYTMVFFGMYEVVRQLSFLRKACPRSPVKPGTGSDRWQESIDTLSAWR